MPRLRLLYLLTPPALLTYTIHRTLTRLETKYPPVPADQGSTRALTTPANPSTQRCAEIDIYQARVPVRALLRAEAALTGTTNPKTITENNTDNPATPPEVSQATLQKAWAHLFLTSPILQTEAKLIGLLTTGRFHPGDVGLSAGGFAPLPSDTVTDNDLKNPENQPQHKRQLINGGFTVERAPEIPGGLLASWRIPAEARAFFERLAQWGYPCRLMSGGRHEWGVSEVYFCKSEEGEGKAGAGAGEWVVDVRFGSAHDYEIVEAEGNAQKVVPRWVGRLHRGFARLLVEDAVRRLRDC
ncbi:hypothetical protein ASPACDRAFT_43598 [Aspergillus aculeatus ATCC 16872]|uniref:Uncharacterized protein n=1 Tax=Aspergillus aculeatus (strain ATCC 16872 / CBS 172.66 / WB 5094) TaxID=690307 RepID=A0A1L9WUQ4_ASPA1|nr:uncharacterized protein ASPACDRAFT_43598 [Aspergillus aculeatus ATCC 16872]OJJ99960.1 hypothetical protein ASPACDRAFT_43598 [Aspergillus aculeatus ATCC 16872]